MRFALACLALSLAPAWAGTPPMSKGQKMLLDKGDVIVKPLDRDNGVAARAMGIVDAPPAKVWPVVRDCEHFSKFMPRTKASSLISRAGNKAVCKVEISMPIPFSNLWSIVDSVETVKGDNFKREWNLKEGTYKRNKGSWELYPWAGGKKTLLIYFVDADPKIAIPDGIIKSAQTGSLPDMYEAVRKRVKSLGG